MSISVADYCDFLVDRFWLRMKDKWIAAEEWWRQETGEDLKLRHDAILLLYHVQEKYYKFEERRGLCDFTYDNLVKYKTGTCFDCARIVEKTMRSAFTKKHPTLAVRQDDPETCNKRLFIKDCIICYKTNGKKPRRIDDYLCDVFDEYYEARRPTFKKMMDLSRKTDAMINFAWIHDFIHLGCDVVRALRDYAKNGALTSYVDRETGKRKCNKCSVRSMKNRPCEYHSPTSTFSASTIDNIICWREVNMCSKENWARVPKKNYMSAWDKKNFGRQTEVDTLRRRRKEFEEVRRRPVE